MLFGSVTQGQRSARAGQEPGEGDGSAIEMPAPRGPQQNGVTFVLEGRGFSADAQRSLRELADTGADWVGFAFTSYQDRLTSTQIGSTTRTPRDADLENVVAFAHRLGLKVLLKPGLGLSNDAGHWSGEIGSAFTNETQWQDWFQAYRAHLGHYAALAQAVGADELSIGNELDGTIQRDAEWRSVIADVRALFSGPVTYGANWGTESKTPWWDALDYIGVSAYYPLTNQLSPSLDELKAAWRERATELADLSAEWERPVLFTEVGYFSLSGSNRGAFTCCSTAGTIDLDEQANAYRAVFETVYQEPWFGGMFWWSWDPDPLSGGPCDGAFTPHEKPAEDVLRAWFGGAPRPAPVAPTIAAGNRSQTRMIYGDGLESGWVDGSWSARRDFQAGAPTRSGTKAISATLDGFGALAFWRSPRVEAINLGAYSSLEFALYGAPQVLRVWFEDRSGRAFSRARVDVCGTAANSWKDIRLPILESGAGSPTVAKLVFGSWSNYTYAPFRVDEVRLIGR